MTDTTTGSQRLREALAWSVPALIAGVVFRCALLSYSPFAYWGSDSSSFFWFTERLFLEGAISLPAKRQFLYPLVLAALTLLPGPALVWVAAVQHAAGLVLTVGVGYIVRSVYSGWRLWIVPLTLVYATLPILVWYEHELIADSLFALTLLAAFWAWVAWERAGWRAGQGWLFVAAFGACILTKSAGRFFWPGLIAGLLLSGAWRKLALPQYLALAILCAVSWTMGERNQGIRLLYTSAFPLTRLDTPLHADYKTEIAPLVRDASAARATYYSADDAPKEFLRTGRKDADSYPRWATAGARDEKQLWKDVKEIALEAVFSDPLGFAGIGLQRTIAAINPPSFRTERFAATYASTRIAGRAEDWEAKGERGAALRRILYGLPQAGSDTLAREISPNPSSPAATMIETWSYRWQESLALVKPANNSPAQFQPTPLGIWMIAAAGLCFLPWFRNSLGAWILIAGGYVLGVHLLGSANPRFALPCFPVLIVIAATPADALWRMWNKKRSARHL
jgi:hypothetical protein